MTFNATMQAKVLGDDDAAGLGLELDDDDSEIEESLEEDGDDEADMEQEGDEAADENLDPNAKRSRVSHEARVGVAQGIGRKSTRHKDCRHPEAVVARREQLYTKSEAIAHGCMHLLRV